MVYENLYTEFVDMFLDDKTWFEEECQKKAIDDEDGMHIVFGMVVVPYILEKAISYPSKLQLAFDYIEKMESSGDPSIAEVVEFSILENLIGVDETKMRKCVGCMGMETKKAYDDLRKWFNK